VPAWATADRWQKPAQAEAHEQGSPPWRYKERPVRGTLIPLTSFFFVSQLIPQLLVLLATAALSVRHRSPPAANDGAAVRGHAPRHTLGSGAASSFSCSCVMPARVMTRDPVME
jgi:hypothetical protein